MTTVRINTSDVDWITRHGVGEPVVQGTDLSGAVYFRTDVEVADVERITFAGASTIRFDLGADAPRDHNRHALYPATYLVSDGA